MRWTHKWEYRRDEWTGRKNGCKHTIATTNDDRYYILSTHVKTDLSLNTLWYNKAFDTLDEAKEYADMPIYPSNGYCKMIDDRVVVKLSD